MRIKHRASRREALILFGAAGATLVGCGSAELNGRPGSVSGSGGSDTPDASPGSGGTTTSGGNGAAGSSGNSVCAAEQETTVGPFPNIDPLERRDVRGNTQGDTTPKSGAELILRVFVYDLDNGCAPIADAVVDIWHAEADGDYSSYTAFSTAGQDYLRGYQRTDAQGRAEFLTIFPGSYAGRAIHIHFSIQGRASNLRINSSGSGLADVFVSQMYFEPSVIDEVWAAFPIYKTGAEITANEADSIYRSGGGAELIVSMTKSGAGYVGELNVGVRRQNIGM